MFPRLMIIAPKLRRVPRNITSDAKFLCVNQRTTFATKIQTAAVKPQKLNDLINRLRIITYRNKQIPHECLDAISNQLAEESPNHRQSLALLQMCRNILTNRNHREAISSILMKLKSNQTRVFRKEHFVLVIQLDQATGDIDGAEATFKEMEKAKIHIPPVAYQIMLQLYCEKCNIEKVTEWIGRISDAKLHLSQGSYNSLTQCYLKCGDLEMVRHTVQIIKLNNFTIHFHTLNEFLKYYARQGDIDNVIKTVNILTENQMTSRSNCVIDAIYELTMKKHERQIVQLLGYLDSDSDVIHWNRIRQIITRFVENGLVFVAPKFLRTISRNLSMSVEFYLHELDRINATPDQKYKAIEALKLAGIDVKITNPNTALNTGNTKTKITITLNDERRFTEFIREKNIAKVEMLVRKGTVLINRRKSVLLIRMYADVKNLDKALDILKNIRIYHKSFRLDYIEVTKLVKLMIEQNRNADEIVDFIRTNRQDDVKHGVFVYEEAFKSLVASGKNALLNQIYKSVIDNSHNEEIESLTEHTMLVHVKNGDFERTVELYEKFLAENNLAPFTSQIFKELINGNRTDLLQRAYNALEMARGQSLAKHRLAMTYVECGAIDKARQIFDSGKITNLAEKLSNEIQVYERFNKIEEAKNLLKATTGNHCDRRHIYRSILEIYCNENQWHEAIELWKEHTNDSAKPNQFFLKRLTILLEKNDRSVPNMIFVKSKPGTD